MQPEATLLGMRATQRAPAGGTSLTAACQHRMGFFSHTFLIKVDLDCFAVNEEARRQLICGSSGQFIRKPSFAGLFNRPANL